MSIAQRNDIEDLKQRVARLEATVDLLCKQHGEACIAADPQHPSRKTLKLPEKKSA